MLSRVLSGSCSETKETSWLEKKDRITEERKEIERGDTIAGSADEDQEEQNLELWTWMI